MYFGLYFSISSSLGVLWHYGVNGYFRSYFSISSSLGVLWHYGENGYLGHTLRSVPHWVFCGIMERMGILLRITKIC